MVSGLVLLRAAIPEQIQFFLPNWYHRVHISVLIDKIKIRLINRDVKQIRVIFH